MSALKVSIGETEIGVLEHFEDESEVFTFADVYLESHIDERPILGQLFEDRIPKPIHVGGPLGWFEHLLPQGVMRRWRTRYLGIDENDSFSLLVHLGEQLPGAVILRPVKPLLGDESSSPTYHKELLKDQAFRFSLAGAQWKLSARSEGRGLTTNVAACGIEHIAKFHSPEYPDLPRCEFATMRWAEFAGVALPKFELRSIQDFDRIPENMPTGNGEVYVCQRFDRSNSHRLHMEDFAQILDRPAGNEQFRGSYEEIARILQWIAPASLEEFLRLVAFNLVCGNGDAHLKNFSVLYKDGRTATLAPAYDLVATVAYLPSDELALELGGSRRFDTIRKPRFDSISEALGWSRNTVVECISGFAQQAISAWRSSEVRENYTQLQREKIEQHVAKIGKQFNDF